MTVRILIIQSSYVNQLKVFAFISLRSWKNEYMSLKNNKKSYGKAWNFCRKIMYEPCIVFMAGLATSSNQKYHKGLCCYGVMGRSVMARDFCVAFSCSSTLINQSLRFLPKVGMLLSYLSCWKWHETLTSTQFVWHAVVNTDWYKEIDKVNFCETQCLYALFLLMHQQSSTDLFLMGLIKDAIYIKSLHSHD